MQTTPIPSNVARVLLIEDNPGDARLVREMLSESRGTSFELACTESLSLGLDKLAKHPFDLLLLDLSLPDSNGLETFERAQQGHPNIPVVLLTGRGDEALAVRAVSEGAQDYLVKDRVDSDQLTRSLSYAIERKRAQDTANRQTALYETLVTAQSDAGEAVTITKGSGQLVYGNDALVQISGYPIEELRRMPSLVPRVFERLPSRGGSIPPPPPAEHTPGRFETMVTQRSGARIHVDVISRAITSGGREQIVSIIRDITPRKLAEEQLRRQAELLDKARDAILGYDVDGALSYWNKSAERLYGWTAEEVLGRDAYALLTAKLDSQAIAEARHATLERGEWTGELNQRTKGGAHVVVESRWTLVGEPGEPSATILAVNTDISEKKLLAAQFLRAQRMESIGTLASGIAHDLNNTLTPMMLAVGALQSRLRDADDANETNYFLDVLELGIGRGAALVRQVLSFARGADGERRDFEPAPLIRDVAKILRQTLPRSIDIRVDVATDLAPLHADATQIYQLLMNVCLNARDAMPRGGELTIAAENGIVDELAARAHLGVLPSAYVVLRVRDTGTGIEPTVIDRIFEPFFTTKEVGRGTGIGLSTALTIARSHGGFIDVVSELGKGSEFAIHLPAIERSVVATEGRDARPAPRGNGETILVVDDEEGIRALAKAALEAQGYEVVTAEDGASALALFSKYRHRVRLVLMDTMMPNLDGGSATRVLQAMEPSLPIVASSGFAPNASVPESSTGPGVAFLAKPYTAERLVRLVGALLAQGR